MGFDIDYLEKSDTTMLHLGLKSKFGLNECRRGYVSLESQFDKLCLAHCPADSGSGSSILDCSSLLYLQLCWTPSLVHDE